MSSLIRTIARSIARLSLYGEPKAKTQPVSGRKRRKGGRKADDYRAIKRAAVLTQARVERKALRAALKANPLAVELPRSDRKGRARECARRLRQIAKAA